MANVSVSEVLQHGCNCHEVNHCSEPNWKQLDLVNSMFCATQCLQNGVRFFNFVGHVRHCLMDTDIVQVKFTSVDDVPSDEVLEQEKKFMWNLLHITFLMSTQAEDGDADLNVGAAKRLELVNDFCKIANGGVRQGRPIHYCKLGCCPSIEVPSWLPDTYCTS
eukprot:TRINITY_DN17444_c0_g1_i1.p1 TRINITY_DN17444_c0_g1~~TRINITY_DN17444_c0_g1_i1.p1  ORF type:complete len:163 (-),score=22.14 TRINITY_DN17444_c0_g1_i1:464-952(-)